MPQNPEHRFYLPNGLLFRNSLEILRPFFVFQIICARSEAVLERELDEARVADCRDDLCQRTWVLDVRGRWIGERRMVGHVEKIGPE